MEINKFYYELLKNIKDKIKNNTTYEKEKEFEKLLKNLLYNKKISIKNKNINILKVDNIPKSNAFFRKKGRKLDFFIKLEHSNNNNKIFKIRIEVKICTQKRYYSWDEAIIQLFFDNIFLKNNIQNNKNECNLLIIFDKYLNRKLTEKEKQILERLKIYLIRFYIKDNKFKIESNIKKIFNMISKKLL